MPAAVTVAGPVFTIDRSADAVTVVVTDEVLFAGFGSASWPTTDGRVGQRRGLDRRASTDDRDRRCRRPGRQRRHACRSPTTLPTFVHVHPVPVAEHEGHPGRQRVGDRHARGVRRTGVRDRERVADRAARHHRRRTGLHDRQVGRGGHRRGGSPTSCSPGSGPWWSRRPRPCWSASPACAGAVTTTVIVGAVVPVARAGRVQVTDDVADVGARPARSRRGHEGDSRRQGVRDRTARRVRRTGVGHHQRVASPCRPPSRSPDRSSRSTGPPSAVTVVVAESVLFAGSGSGVGARHVAVFVSGRGLRRCRDDHGDRRRRRPGRQRRPGAGHRHVAGVRARPPAAGRRHERDPGRQGVDDRHGWRHPTGRRWPRPGSRSPTPPAVTVAGPVFTIDRSADAVTVVVTDDVLFARFGSGRRRRRPSRCSSASPPAAGAVTTTVIVGAVAPAARRRPGAGHRHVRRRSCTTQPVPVADTNVTPAGSVSVHRRGRPRPTGRRSPRRAST